MKNNLQIFSLISAIILLLPKAVFAHVGNMETTSFGSGFMHPIQGMDHFLAMFAVGLWAAQMGGGALWKVPSVFVLLMIFGGALAISGFYVPYVEEGILVSVLVLGIMIAASLKLPMVISAFIVGLFAVFHGYAHGAEMPLAMRAVQYSLGFALGTAVLHMAGIAGGIMLSKTNTERVIRYAGGAIACGGIFLVFA